MSHKLDKIICSLKVSICARCLAVHLQRRELQPDRNLLWFCIFIPPLNHFQTTKPFYKDEGKHQLQLQWKTLSRQSLVDRKCSHPFVVFHQVLHNITVCFLPTYHLFPRPTVAPRSWCSLAAGGVEGETSWPISEAHRWCFGPRTSTSPGMSQGWLSGRECYNSSLIKRLLLFSVMLLGERIQYS